MLTGGRFTICTISYSGCINGRLSFGMSLKKSFTSFGVTTTFCMILACTCSCSIWSFTA